MHSKFKLHLRVSRAEWQKATEEDFNFKKKSKRWELIWGRKESIFAFYSVVASFDTNSVTYSALRRGKIAQYRIIMTLQV